MPINKQEWASQWPTTLDWNFDFYKLLYGDEKEIPLGTIANDDVKIAIVGAGISGLLAARELLKAGCRHVDIYEASDRIGGRTYSVQAKGQKTTYELGAMRVPFFDTTKEGNIENGKFIGSKNCILDYLRRIFDIGVIEFPVPGSSTCHTGLYLRDDIFQEKPNDIHLYLGGKSAAGNTTGKLEDIIKKWDDFAKTFKEFVSEKYKNSSVEEWKRYWGKIVKHYHAKDFRELVFEQNLTSSYQALKDTQEQSQKQLHVDLINFFNAGNFGGLGLNNDDATTFFTVGAGDGGWGAFYDISSLYVIRVLLGGYGSHQKLITGHQFEKSHFFNHEVYKHLPIVDSMGNELAKPLFLGVQSFAECLFYNEIRVHRNEKEETLPSVYQQSKIVEVGQNMPRVNFYINEPVQEVVRKDKDSFMKLTSKNFRREYTAVILSTPTWATQVNMNLKFQNELLPTNVRQSMKFSHWIHSCKLFFPLKERFWDNPHFCKDNLTFPQVLLTDSFIQDMYIYAASEQDPGVLLASYTWEDNAMKMLGFENDQELADACLRKLDSIFIKSQLKTRDGKPIIISNYVNRENPTVIQWSKKPNYAGCAKLYRQNNEIENSHLLNYNRKYSEYSNLYFAGEAYSVEGGWIEPATRVAIDAVIHIIKNNGILREGFYDDYLSLTETQSYLNEYYLHDKQDG